MLTIEKLALHLFNDQKFKRLLRKKGVNEANLFYLLDDSAIKIYLLSLTLTRLQQLPKAPDHTTIIQYKGATYQLQKNIPYVLQVRKSSSKPHAGKSNILTEELVFCSKLKQALLSLYVARREKKERIAAIFKCFLSYQFNIAITSLAVHVKTSPKKNNSRATIGLFHPKKIDSSSDECPSTLSPVSFGGAAST